MPNLRDLGVGLVAAAVLAGCGGGAAPVARQPAEASDPDLRESTSAAPAFDVGHTVHITASGPQPQSLASLCCAPIVFKNETGGPVSVAFFNSSVESGPIAPGSTWQWTPPNPESVGYHLGGDHPKTGHIQVESPNW